MTVSEAPEVVLVNCPTCVLIIDVPLVPAFTVNVPELIKLPTSVIVLLPETPRVTPLLAVRLLGRVMLPLVVVSDSVPEELPPTDMALESVIPPAELILREVSALGAVPRVRVELP